jgi:hypothetical protein
MAVPSKGGIVAQVSRSLGVFVEEYDVAGIAAEIVERFGAVDLVDLPDEEQYWELVERYELEPSA